MKAAFSSIIKKNLPNFNTFLKNGRMSLLRNSISFGYYTNLDKIFYTTPLATFAKKGGDKNDKKSKKEKEKESINKEYSNVSIDELKSKYKSKADAITINLKEALNEIRVQRSNPRILDNILVNIKGKRMKLAELANIMLKAANVMVINPFEESHKDAIIKSIESSKLDVQVTTEGSGIAVTIGAITDDAKTENLQKLKKLNDSSKEELKTLRQQCVNEMKKLEKILGKDESRRVEKGILELIEKSGKQIEQSYKKKEEEIKSS